MTLDEQSTEDLLLERPEFVADTERFAVFTQLARLLAAEDIIVRWNVRGMDCPASMNYATRVLDVAPIRKDRENMIPGLILHEVGHFLFSENVMVQDVVGHAIDVTRANNFRDKIKNHRVWNIIEDGFIERRVVAKWPGALKHFRVLYDFDLEMEYSTNRLGSFEIPGFIIPEIINTLHKNVLGSKWNERFDYPAKTPKKLLGLLERARVCMGTPDDRAELSTQIVEELAALVKPKVVPKPKVVEVPVPAARTTDDDEPSDIDVMIKDLKDAVENKQEKMSRKEKDKIIKEIKQSEAQDFVEKALGADLTVENKKNEVAPAPEATVETDGPDAEVVEPDDSRSGFGAGGAGQNADAPTSEDASQENDEPTEDDDDVEDDYAILEQHISDSKARMIGENKSYLENVMVDLSTDVNGKEDSVRHIPTMNQVLATSKIVDMMSDNVKKATADVSFRRFLAALSKSTYNETKRLPNQFNKKLALARATAQQMYQRFTTKANATNIALTRYRTTGSLDPTRAALYQIYDDVFQKRRQAPKQVNHGYVVMVDWSSSMSDSSLELFHRIVELTYFAQLANVEIDIWLYTTESSYTSDSDLKDRLLASTALLQPNVLLLGSKFVHVINTKQHGGDQLNYRLYSMFINAVKIKNHRMYSSLLGPRTSELGLNFADEVLHTQSGTNIFEALNFAISRASKFTTERKAIILMTDGDDNCFGTVTDGKGGSIKGAHIPMDLTFAESKYITQVMYNGVNLIDIAKAAVEITPSRFSGYRSTPLVNAKTLASMMLADEARAQGISIIGITWGSYISAHMEAWSRKNVVRIEVPYKDLLSKNVNVYSPVVNTFITNITEALLSNIKK